MKKRTIMITVAAAVAGFALFLAARKKAADRTRKRKREDVANVFSHAKRHGGGEFVL